jgi:hypothetical protein
MPMGLTHDDNLFVSAYLPSINNTLNIDVDIRIYMFVCVCVRACAFLIFSSLNEFTSRYLKFIDEFCLLIKF